QARGLPTRRARIREADADQRDRVPAQGEDVRALLADRPAREDAPGPASRLPRRAPVPPPPAVRVWSSPSRPPGRVGRPRDPGLDLRRRARGPDRAPCRGRGRCRDRALLRAGELGNGRVALELPSARRACDLAAGRGHALNRVIDVAIAGASLAIASPFL